MPLVASATVPATTANLGPGFDCIGAALTLYNQFDFVCREEPEAPPVSIKVPGSQSSLISKDKTNLVYQAFKRLYDHLDQDPPSVEITIKMSIPLARGLGSSATAIIGGLLGANQLAGTPLGDTELLQLAIAIEGHPDNIVPALLGGCRLAAASQSERGMSWQICDVTWHESIIPTIAVPNFALSTEKARSVLPFEVSRSDAIFNISRLGLLLRGLEKGDGDWLRTALQDKIHQPYRQILIPGYKAVQKAAMDAGAYGMVISGAGPSLLALAHFQKAKEVAAAMAEAWNAEGIAAQARPLNIDGNGARSRREMVTRRMR
ncbi:MAG: homoserine kinase [Cyanobacteria bacterium P01_E01_bin.42]